jgi:hypothetical protein
MFAQTPIGCFVLREFFKWRGSNHNAAIAAIWPG